MSKQQRSLVDDVKDATGENPVMISDITLCYGIRTSEVTPWIIERLKFALNFYNPSPNFLIIDFGSKTPYADEIQSICDEHGAKSIHIDDDGVFSASKARNIAFSELSTDFIFFADIDFIYESDIFNRLVTLANRLELKKNPRKILTMPIFHVNKEATEHFEFLPNNIAKDKLIMKWSFDGLGTKFGDIFEFVAPYSNTFFMHRKMFDIAGGYCDEFRGHGSEDFEFLIRLAKLSTNIPVPTGLEKDFYGPLKGSFWGEKEYIGFRRYLEAFTLPSESLGLKAFHLWHEKPSAKGYWTQSNDWKRERFNTVLNRHSKSNSQLLSVDYIEREKNALCIFSDKAQWGYFLPLRLAGYNLSVLNEKNDEAISSALYELEHEKYDRVFIFNPYMKSHSVFRSIIEVAKKLNIRVTVIERGGLPNSIYYADEVAYGDKEYSTIMSKLDEIYFTDNELKSAEKILLRMKEGNTSLESMDSYSKTWIKHTLLRFSDKKKIFIPLQLRDDMAVNYFTNGYPSYQEYEENIQVAVENNPDLLFIIKQHPLSKYDLSWTNSYENIICADQNDNIHALIEISDAVTLYNSGVGLLAMIHNKPVFHIGNAYYSGNNSFAHRCVSVSESADLVKKGGHYVFNEEKLKLFFTWLIFKKYSWFNAQDIIREFVDRKSHAYDNICVEILNLDGVSTLTGSSIDGYDYSNKSYLNWHLNINSDISTPPSKPVTKAPPKPKPIPKDTSQIGVVEQIKTETLLSSNVIPNQNTKSSVKSKTIVGMIVVPVVKTFTKSKMKNKISKNPYLFFADSKHASLRAIGRVSFK